MALFLKIMAINHFFNNTFNYIKNNWEASRDLEFFVSDTEVSI